ncbi:MAG: 3-oxoacyl-[acyl-carrier-protein] reductase [Bacillus sp. (in: firmicutes)]
MKLLEQTAIVTGASRGIGRAIALELANAGANVAVIYAGSEEKAKAVVDEICSLGRNSVAIRCDVSNSEQVSAMMKQVSEELGTVDILINNAGITKDNLLMRMKEEEWDQVIDTNLKGTFLCTKAVARMMMKKRKGKIVNIASVVGLTGNAGQANYVAAKAGIVGLTKTAARELAPRGINVNAIAPGFISTDMTEKLSADITGTMLSQIPLARFGKPSDIAKAVLFLSSDDSSYMTGQVMAIDGGMVM